MRLDTEPGPARAVRVSVTDTGVGIPPGELESIFEKFVQSSRTRSNAGGTGLGLSICREIVEAHGGRIWAENRAGGGSCFAFVISAIGERAHAARPTDLAPAEARRGRAA